MENKNMKTLKFRDFKIQRVLDGTKTSSMRLFDEKNIQEGDDLQLINSDTGEGVARAKVTKVIEKKLKELNDDDFEGHEEFDDDKEMLKTFRKYYGDGVTMDTVVKVIHFRLLNAHKL